MMMNFGYPEPTSAAELFARYEGVRNRLGGTPLRARLTPMAMPVRALPPPEVKIAADPEAEQQVIYLLPPPFRTEEQKIQNVARNFHWFIERQPWRNKAKLIQWLVSTEFNVSVDDMLVQNRDAKLVRIRSIAMMLCLRLANCPVSSAGYYFKRDHTTIIHAKKRMTPVIEKALSAS